MSEKRYKIRKDRISAVLMAVVVSTIVLIILSRCRQSKVTESSSVKIQTSVSTACTALLAEEPVTTVQPVTIPHIDSPEHRAAAMYSVNDKKYLYSDNINIKIAPASLTKLLTASVALKYADNEKVFAVGSEQWLVQPYSSLCYLQIGNMLTLEDLITGMLMASGNDAAYTIAVCVARELNPETYMTDDEAVRYFCNLMNDFAHELGMTNSSFVNPDGWDDDDQYTTISDLIKISEYALSVPEIRQITSTYKKNITIYSGENFIWTNSNLLLDPNSGYYTVDAVGMKTGTTLSAGNSLIAVFDKGEEIYISAVAGCETDADRYELTLKLLSFSE